MDQISDVEPIKQSFEDVAESDRNMERATLSPKGDPIQMDEDHYNIRYVDGEIATFAMGDIPDGIGRVVESLESNDTYDVLLFSAPTSRQLRTIFYANSADYRMNIGRVDLNTMQLTVLTHGYSPNTIVDIQLPSIASNERYAFYISSLGQYGQLYQVDYNYTMPYNANKLIGANFANLLAMDSYTGALYFNGEFIVNLSNRDPSFDYEDEYYVTWSLDGYGGYKNCSISIEDVNIDRDNIKAPMTYSAPGVYSKNAYSELAIFIPVEADSLIKSCSTYYQSGPNHVRESDWTDSSGQTTPRRLQNTDVGSGVQNYLVYDLAAKKVIDWYSVYNSIYSIGYKDLPTISYLL